MARVPHASRSLRVALALTLTSFAGLGLGACADSGTVTNYHVPEDVGDALQQLPKIESVEVGQGGIPYFVRGDLGRTDRVADLVMAQAKLAPALTQIAPVFRLRAADLAPISLDNDDLGMTHVKYMQTKAGIEVVGGELIVHVGADGVLRSVTASARGNDNLGSTPKLAAEAARLNAALFTPAVGAVAETPRLVYVVSSIDGDIHLAWESRVTAPAQAGVPVDDLVYVDALSGALADRHPQIMTAKSRSVYSANNGTSLPGTLKRSEGGAASSDTDVNAAYDNTGAVYDGYKSLFNRDSYNNSGAALKSSVHYSQSYVNAYWDGTQMVYGDGDNSNSIQLDRALDVTAHELTHAVTEYTWNGNYQNESGALNEGWSDIFGAVIEWNNDGKVVSADTWKVGEDVWTPGVSGDALRYMNDPAKDGSSADYYPNRYTGSSDNGGVHSNSGIANLAFYLAVQGGTHPRGRTSVQVTGIGMDKAAQIFYRAATNYMTSTTNFAGARTATANAANELYGSDAKCSVDTAWYAVGVGSAPTCGSTPPPPPPGGGTIALTSGVSTSVASMATNATQMYSIVVPSGSTSLTVITSGGSGDADIYVKAGAAASTTNYDGKSEGSTTAETVTISNPQATTYYIFLNAYAAISGVSIKATVGGSTPPPTGNVLTNGVPVTGLAGATGATVTYTFQVPAGSTKATFQISGGSGDADLYVRYGAAPTTSTYDGRPYLTGNAETWSKTSPQAGTWYVMVRAYATYSGVSLKATAQ
jgi:Zn-dependent metalloprotease